MKNSYVILVVMVVILMSGCNTARGFGADLELLGKSMKTMGNKQETVTVEGATTEVQQGETVYRNGEQVQTYPVTSEQVYQETYTEVPSAVTYPVDQVIQEGQPQ